MEKILHQIMDKLTSMDGELKSVNHRLGGLESRFDNLESRFDNLESRFDSLESRFDSLESRFDSSESRFDSLECKVNGLESQVSENTQILRVLEHKFEVQKADMDNLTHQTISLAGEVKSIKQDTQEIKDINRSLLEMYGDHEAYIRSLRRRFI